MNYSDALLTGNGVTLSEALSEGLKVTGTGLAIVFGVLIILMIVLMLFKVIFYKDPAKQTKAEPVQAAAPAPATAPAEEDVDEAELIAVLTAAVAASLNTSTYNLQIKSYRRIDSKRPAWNKAGVRETINSRF
jgi:sodium pump decarboxylase gamma subunit